MYQQFVLSRTNCQVKYWALGNETWGPWQVEQMTKEDYAHKAFQWAKGMLSDVYQVRNVNGMQP